ncbi:MAG TPA: rhodanese-related sulfurtransferase [Paenirhodobacter sp.]
MTDPYRSSASRLAPALASMTPQAVRAALLARQEILLADLREEDIFARGHPLWAANFPLGRLELDVPRRIPRRDVLIVLYGQDEDRDLAPIAAARLHDWGYENVHLLQGGLTAWRAQGYETFIDVNAPSKAFGELVEARRHTPLLPAEEVQRLLASDHPPVIVDARRFDEFQTMSIPGGISVPGAELVLRVRALAPDPKTQVIVNCAGRTRSIIGTQSLLNAGVPNPVAGLRNGTIGWLLAGLTLDHGAQRRFSAVSDDLRAQARADARAVAARAGVPRVTAEQAARAVPGRSIYRIDVRPPEEYALGHLPGFQNVPGGQLVQEVDHAVPVRGARIVLADDDGARADMTGSWLAQMGWDVQVVAPPETAQYAPHAQPDIPAAAAIAPPSVPRISALRLNEWLHDSHQRTVVVDITASADYVRGHIPGAWFALRSRFAKALRVIGRADRYVLSCGTGALAAHAVADLQALTGAQVFTLEGGTQGWQAAGFPIASGEENMASARIDRYRRPYEGTDAPRAAMQAYLDWEYGLVAQLERDGTHFFTVI